MSSFIEFADQDGKVFMRFGLKTEHHAKQLRSELAKRHHERDFSMLLSDTKTNFQRKEQP